MYWNSGWTEQEKWLKAHDTQLVREKPSAAHLLLSIREVFKWRGLSGAFRMQFRNNGLVGTPRPCVSLFIRSLWSHYLLWLLPYSFRTVLISCEGSIKCLFLLSLCLVLQAFSTNQSINQSIYPSFYVWTKFATRLFTSKCFYSGQTLLMRWITWSLHPSGSLDWSLYL